MVRIARELDVRDENLKLGLKLLNEGPKRGKNMGSENKASEVPILSSRYPVTEKENDRTMPYGTSLIALTESHFLIKETNLVHL